MMMVPAYVSCSESSGSVTSLYALTQFNTNELTLTDIKNVLYTPGPQLLRICCSFLCDTTNPDELALTLTLTLTLREPSL